MTTSFVRNLRKKHKLQRELDVLPEGEAWLLIECGAQTTREAENAAHALRARLRRSVTSGKVLTDQHEIEMVWRVRESALGATAFVPGESATWEGWEDAAVPPERRGDHPDRSSEAPAAPIRSAIKPVADRPGAELKRESLVNQ